MIVQIEQQRGRDNDPRETQSQRWAPTSPAGFGPLLPVKNARGEKRRRLGRISINICHFRLAFRPRFAFAAAASVAPKMLLLLRNLPSL